MPAPRSAPAAPETASLRLCAPSEPPVTTSVRARGSRPRRAAASARTSAASAARAATRSWISRRSGSPVTTPPLSGVPSNVTPTRAAHRAPRRFARPGRAFCSWITTGTSRRRAARYAGVET
ncbi:Uncharacterised protein [Mycobacteroides abscessus]|nr:Uncharacterised protein [Mycobacteroides abscessus]